MAMLDALRDRHGMTPNTMERRRLICGVDGSEAAPRVLAVASRLADALDLRLTLVHSAYPDVFLTGERRRAVLDRGAALLDRLAPDVPSTDRIVDVGDPAELLSALLQDGAALGVVGSRGRGAARAAVLGSVSQQLAGSAACPIVVMPPHASLDRAHGATVVCGVDGSVEAATALHTAGGLATALDGRLVVVYVRAATGVAAVPSTWAADRRQAPVEDGRAALAVVESAAAELELDVPVSRCVESGDPAERLSALAREHRSAILAVGSRRQSSLRAALLGSVSPRLTAIAESPVVIASHMARVPRFAARSATGRSGRAS